VPGPKLYAFSDIPYLYQLLSGNLHECIRQLHEEYGPVVRYTPTDVSFITPGAWRTIYGHRIGTSANIAAFPKDPQGYRPSESGHPQILNANEVDHRRHRRVLAHAFSDKALRGQESILQHYVNKLVTRLRELATAVDNKSSVVDMVRWYNFTTFDIIGDLTFGEPFGCLDSGGYHPWVAMLFDDIRLITVDEAFRRRPALGSMVWKLVPKKWLAARMEHWERSRQTAMRRVESGNTGREDIMSYILRHNYDEQEGKASRGPTLSQGELVENANLLLLAGSETTATVLCGMTYWLLRRRETYDRLVKEIRSAFAKDEDITVASLSGLEYLTAVIEEGLRMCKSPTECFPCGTIFADK
jgi:cytochrome P450